MCSQSGSSACVWTTLTAGSAAVIVRLAAVRAGGVWCGDRVVGGGRGAIEEVGHRLEGARWLDPDVPAGGIDGVRPELHRAERVSPSLEWRSPRDFEEGAPGSGQRVV